MMMMFFPAEHLTMSVKSERVVSVELNPSCLSSFFPLFICFCLLQGPTGGKGEKGERVSVSPL